MSAFLLAALTSPAYGWSEQGHRMVAELAQRQLSPEANAEVARLLEGEREPTLAGVSAWADQLRATDPEEGRRTAAWHYINFPEGDCSYDAARDCPGGDCIVEAIERQAELLADRTQPDAERARALKFVVHFVGDVHQPMHAGRRDDRGGNDYQISLRTELRPDAYGRYFYDAETRTQGTNLHAVWDRYVLLSRGLGWAEYADALAAEGVADVPRATPAAWAEQSCALIRDEGLYPDGHRMNDADLERLRPLAEAQVRAAAVRLAAVLEPALAGSAEGRGDVTPH
ncbi:S1/P1 nuclease [Coralloluteibacterium thermophilus]|uniref:S1/P1 nuclease n=1 Tax=Coralloluteibacterium thermophilum TaxID=2707049 RepID=UPI00366FD2F4